MVTRHLVDGGRPGHVVLGVERGGDQRRPQSLVHLAAAVASARADPADAHFGAKDRARDRVRCPGRPVVACVRGLGHARVDRGGLGSRRDQRGLRRGAEAATGALLWIAAVAGLGALALGLAAGGSGGVLWLSVPAAAALLLYRWRRSASRT